MVFGLIYTIFGIYILVKYREEKQELLIIIETYITEPSIDEEIPEVVSDVAFTTEEEIDQENKDEGILLEEALERFWLKNIQPLYQDRSRSILSDKMIEVLVNKRPTSKEDWFTMMPTELRKSVNPDEGEFRQDIFEIIEEYELI